MTFWLYNIVLLFGLAVGWPVALVALLCVPKFRAGFWEKCGAFNALEMAKISSEKSIVILHAVSVGEFQAARPIIDWLCSRSDVQVVLTQTTRTGHTLASQTYPDLPSLYFPFDFPWVISAWLKRLSPVVILMMETEIWPNLAFLHHPQKTGLILMNGRLSPRSFQKYRLIRPFMKSVLSQYQAIWAQSELDAEHFKLLGVSSERLSCVGNLKYVTRDNTAPQKVVSPSQKPFQALLAGPWAGQPIIIWASSHDGEEALFLETWLALREHVPEVKAIFVPRHPERFARVYELLKAASRSLALWSQLPHLPPNSPIDALLVDAIGELEGLFPSATIAVMGGSFVPVGGHNIMEPLQAGVPVLVGPFMHNFKAMTEQALLHQAIIQVHNASALQNSLKTLLDKGSGPQHREALIAAGRDFRAQQQGVLNAYQDRISAILKS